MEVKPAMLYCSKCQMLVTTGDVCPSCGGTKLREVGRNDPVLLYTADETNLDRIRAALDENEIPHEERMCGPGAPPSILYGKAPYANYHIFVPFQAVEHCKEILQEIGVSGENDCVSEVDETEEKEKSNKNQVKLAYCRMMTAILFLSLVAVVVFFTDQFIDFLKSIFV
jgi:predicted  nucleic acid-binding Zn-ribbon protein